MSSDDQGEGYSGSSSYMYIEPLISGRGRTLRVICPFISARYAKLLVGQSVRKEVSVITSNSKISEDAVRIMRRGKRFPYLTLSSYFIILSILIAALHLYLAELVLVPITALIVGVTAAHYARPRRQRINVRVASENFVHEKIYLGDNYAIVGSANLTYSGLHKNVEHIEVIRDSAKLSQMSKHFEELWRSIAT